ncbi:hypothetical protein BDZ89DRAFT_1043448 [Hymenopellis radicata]|nr:hypothetical protein BDZ89DRAFT_1043448 [Hymenopellis radicata]
MSSRSTRAKGATRHSTRRPKLRGRSVASYDDPSDVHPRWTDKPNRFELEASAILERDGGLEAYIKNYEVSPSPALLPQYVDRPPNARWRNAPIPPMLAFTENAVNQAIELSFDEGGLNLAKTFERTGVHVNASDRYVDWLDTEAARHGSLEFMLPQHPDWRYKPTPYGDEEQPMDIDDTEGDAGGAGEESGAGQEEDDDEEEEIIIRPRRRTRGREVVYEDEREEDGQDGRLKRLRHK